MTQFRINDRVMVLTDDDGNTPMGTILPCSFSEDLIGTVVYMDEDQSSHEKTLIGVVFDTYVDGHELDGKCKWGHGWFFYPQDLFLCVPEAEYDEYPVDFEVGDLVTKATETYHTIPSGLKGADVGEIVALIEPSEYGYEHKWFGVRFDTYVQGNDLRDDYGLPHCSSGYGWWFSGSDLKFALNTTTNCGCEIGDKVKILDGMPRSGKPGKVGTIIAVRDGSLPYGVLFDEHIYGHHLRHRCTDGYGWWFSEKDVEPANVEPAELEVEKAEIRVGDTVKVVDTCMGPSGMSEESVAEVMYIDRSEDEPWCSLMFTDYVQGHDLVNLPHHDALCEDGYGWFVEEKFLKRV